MISYMSNNLRGLDMETKEGFLMYFIMIYLLAYYGPFKIDYNTYKEKWTISE